MKIIATAEHIKRGACGESDACPIALALKDAGFKLPRVESDIYCGGKIFKASKQVCDFIGDFDTGENVKPFEFEIPITP